jgi:hypothetical protein
VAKAYAGRSHTSTGMMSGTRGGLTIQIEEKGLDEMIAKLQTFARIGDTDAKRVRAGMNQTVKLVRARANETVPVRTGALKQSLFGKTKTWGEGNVTGNVGSQLGGSRFLVPFVLEGGRQANKRGRMAITPRRWLYHAYSRVKDQVDQVWKGVLEKITQDLAGKG